MLLRLALVIRVAQRDRRGGALGPWPACALLLVALIAVPADAQAREEVEEHVLQPGDEIVVVIPQQDPGEQNVRVDLQGEIFLRPYGAVKVGGLTVDEAERKVRQSLRRYVVRTVGITVILKKVNRLVLVSGMVREPGLKEVGTSGDIWQAIQAAGGVAAGADLTRVVLGRDGAQQIVDLRAYLSASEGTSLELPDLKAGDVIFVPAGPGGATGGGEGGGAVSVAGDFLSEGSLKNKVFIIGAVHSPGLYPRSPGLTPLTALGLAGGTTSDADLTAVRQLTPSSSVSINVLAAMSGPSRVLPPFPEGVGSILYVPPKDANVGPAIHVVGAVTAPGRIPVNGPVSLPDAIALAGGPDQEADLDDVRHVRVGPGFTLASEYRLDKWFEEGGILSRAMVNPGDSVLVEWRPHVWRDVLRVLSDLTLISSSIAILFTRGR